MTRRGPLWLWGVCAWAATATALGVALTSRPSGCDHDAIAGAIAWGGVPGIALIAAGFVRRPRVSTGLLLAWAVVFWLGTWGTAASDWGDCDQLVGVALWAFVPGIFVVTIAAPAAAVVYLTWHVARDAETAPRETLRPRRWRAEIEGSSLVLRRRRGRRKG
ncbi:MAG TPA: hypothetical protein VHN37_12385 [Actinomycetota bacterium]|nr:hypothetical protein [Actinomycetota bacterium]